MGGNGGLVHSHRGGSHNAPPAAGLEQGRNAGGIRRTGLWSAHSQFLQLKPLACPPLPKTLEEAVVDRCPWRTKCGLGHRTRDCANKLLGVPTRSRQRPWAGPLSLTSSRACCASAARTGLATDRPSPTRTSAHEQAHHAVEEPLPGISQTIRSRAAPEPNLLDRGAGMQERRLARLCETWRSRGGPAGPSSASAIARR